MENHIRIHLLSGGKRPLRPRTSPLHLVIITSYYLVMVTSLKIAFSWGVKGFASTQKELGVYDSVKPDWAHIKM